MARDQKFVAFLDAVYGLERREFDYREVEYTLERVLRELEMRPRLEEGDVARRDAESELFYRLRELHERLRYESRMWPFGRYEMDYRLRREIEMIEMFLAEAEHIGGPVYDRLRSLLQFPPEDASPMPYLCRDSPLSEVILPVLQRFKHQDLAEARLEEVEAALTKALLATLATGEGKLHMDAARGLYAYQREVLAKQVLDDLNSADVTRCARALSICTSSWYEEGRPAPDTLVAAWRRCAAVEQVRLLERLVSVVGQHAITLGLLFELLENPDEQLQAAARANIEGMNSFEADNNVLALLARELRATSEVRRRHAVTLMSKLKGKKDLEIKGSPLMGWLEDKQQDVRIFAAFVLAESAHMVPEVICLLVEALKDRRDEIRTRTIGIIEPDGEITVTASELELWLRLYEDNSQLGFVRGTIYNRLVAVKHSDVQLVASWFDSLGSDDETKSRLASNALGYIYKATPEVIHLLCERAGHGSATVQRAVLSALWNLQEETPEVVEVLIALLRSSQDESVRRSACNTLGRLPSTHFEVASALLEALKDPSPKVRDRAAWFLGKMYPRLIKAGTKAPSKEQVRQQLYNALPSQEDDYLNQAFEEPVFQAAADAQAALLLLQNLEHIDIKPVIVSVLAQSKKLPGLVYNLLDEVRNAPKRQALCDQIFAALVEHLANEETVVAQNAAEAIARIKQQDKDVLEILHQHLPDDHEVLRALWASASDADSWGDYHEQAVKNLVALVEQNPMLVEDLLSALQHHVEGNGSDWQARRILIATFAAVTEGMPSTLQAKRPLDEVLQLFVAAAKDSNSFSTRRWAIKALGNLRQATPEVLEALFAACRDTSTVYNQAVEAAHKFRRIEPRALDLLFAALTDPSVRVCQNAANMLGELAAGQEELKKPIAAALYQTLGDPSSIREDKDGKPLYDYFYDALVRVVG